MRSVGFLPLPLLIVLVASPAWAQTGGSGTGEDPPGGTATGDTTSPSSGATSSPPPSTPPASPGSAGSGTGTAPPPQVVVVRQEPARSEPREEDDGRDVDFLWIEPFFGYSYVDLVMFSQENFLPSVERLSGGGFVGGLAAGMRMSFIMFGGRGTLASYNGFDLWTLGGEIHLRIPLGALEPYARVGFGYGWVGQANYDEPEASTSDVYGLVVDAAAGLDIYLDKVFAIGVGMDGAFLNLSRQRIDQDGCTTADCMVDEINFREDGDAAGLQLRLHAHASLHF